MGNLEKFSNAESEAIISHILREVCLTENINPELTELNYQLSPKRRFLGHDIRPYDYYKLRLSNIYCYGRDNLVTLCSWIFTAPSNLPTEQYELFFRSVYQFLEAKYGKENIVISCVHRDEEAEHMHTTFIPAVPDTNPRHKQNEKACCNDLINRKHLLAIHPELQKHLFDNGIYTRITSGITAAQGGNKTIKEMKKEREQERSRDIERGFFTR